MNENIDWMDLEDEIYKLEDIKNNIILASMAFETYGNISNEITMGALNNIVESIDTRLESLKQITFCKEGEKKNASSNIQIQ